VDGEQESKDDRSVGHAADESRVLVVMRSRLQASDNHVLWTSRCGILVAAWLTGQKEFLYGFEAVRKPPGFKLRVKIAW